MATTTVNGSNGNKGTASRPNQSLYIQNLSVKEKKEDLLRLLYMTFTSEASVIDVTVMKSEKMRGQAHILFKDVQSATYAMEKLQGTMFLDRPLVSLTIDHVVWDCGIDSTSDRK
jgi:RNA recognition motif-containing protein